MNFEEFIVELRKLLIVPAWREIWKEEHVTPGALRRKESTFRAVVLWNQEQGIGKLICESESEYTTTVLYAVANIFDTYVDAIKWYMTEIEEIRAGYA